MKKKIFIILLIISIFSLTGCDVTYELDLDLNRIEENITITGDKIISESSVNDLFSYYAINSYSELDKDISEIDNKTVALLKGKRDKVTAYFANEESLINSCFDRVSFSDEKDESKYYIGTSKGFNCLTYDYMEFENITIKIKTYNKVFDHNADEVKNGTYIWHINRENNTTSSIMFIVSKNQYVWYYRYRYTFYGIVGIILLFTILYIIKTIFDSTSNRANKV